ncbi:MAG: DUF4303 domain-containing protein [Phycisphaerae bacterium]|nr:DUF4303 domain-containing protein [Tepidisphaeraceae bacterium]
MDLAALQIWMVQVAPRISTAVARDVRVHADRLRSAGIDFYGYAILPGEPARITRLFAAANADANLKVGPREKMYRYYRYSVDEWAHRAADAFPTANPLLDEVDRKFRQVHPKSDGDYQIDKVERALADGLLDAIVVGLEQAKAAGAFAPTEPFLVVWLADSGHRVMTESARRLNAKPVAKEFLKEFG